MTGEAEHIRQLQEQDERNLAEMATMQAEIDSARRRRDEAYAESDEIATELHNERARANRIDAGIRGLHKPVRVGSVEVCLTCTDAAGAASFPCPTIAVLDGEATS